MSPVDQEGSRMIGGLVFPALSWAMRGFEIEDTLF
jgi:hypothetical protein